MKKSSEKIVKKSSKEIVEMFDESKNSVDFVKALIKNKIMLCPAKTILEDENRIVMIHHPIHLKGRIMNENEIVNLYGRDKDLCIEILGKNQTIEYFNIIYL